MWEKSVTRLLNTIWHWPWGPTRCNFVFSNWILYFWSWIPFAYKVLHSNLPLRHKWSSSFKLERSKISNMDKNFWIFSKGIIKTLFPDSIWMWNFTLLIKWEKLVWHSYNLENWIKAYSKVTNELIIAWENNLFSYLVHPGSTVYKSSTTRSATESYVRMTGISAQQCKLQ